MSRYSNADYNDDENRVRRFPSPQANPLMLERRLQAQSTPRSSLNHATNGLLHRASQKGIALNKLPPPPRQASTTASRRAVASSGVVREHEARMSAMEEKLDILVEGQSSIRNQLSVIVSRLNRGSSVGARSGPFLGLQRSSRGPRVMSGAIEFDDEDDEDDGNPKESSSGDANQSAVKSSQPPPLPSDSVVRFDDASRVETKIEASRETTKQGDSVQDGKQILSLSGSPESSVDKNLLSPSHADGGHSVLASDMDSDDSDDDSKFRQIQQFRLIDTNGNKRLDLNEILSGAKILGLSDNEARSMFSKMEKDKDDEVVLDKFLQMYERMRTTTFSDDSYRSIVNEKSNCMFDPRDNLRIAWDLAVMMPLLLYLLVMLPFRFGFDNEARLFTWVYWFEFILDFLFILDMCFNFRTGIYVSALNSRGEFEEAIEYNPRRVAISYIKSWFFVDLFSGVPFSFIDLVVGGGGAVENAKSLKALRFFKLARLLKLGRLLKIKKIYSSIDRDTLDLIEDIFQDGHAVNTLLSLVVVMAFVCHLMGCGWVAVGKVGYESGVDNWLEVELKGPFTSADTTGVNGNRPVYSIFIASFYFCLTTMCSVGYGDISARNNIERLYVIFLELASSIVFGTSIALITKVITSVDIGAQKEAERLAEVTSFVSFRQFPDKLARRIRRHFRNFYSHKTATDEKKIFSELSTSLRKDVSEYMVIELMGSESFFMAMSASLWPRLLPLLQPAAFEAGERVCLQGEDCEEVTVIINGVFVGSTLLDGEEKPRVVRTLTKGGSLNVLCVLAIWPKCVESVVTRRYSETYVVKTEDFLSLFQTDFDVKNFVAMQKREIKKFWFVPSMEAPTNVGMPLFMCCYAAVEITLIKVTGSVLRNDIRSPLSWVVIDLVESSSGIKLNEFWCKSTAGSSPEVLSNGTPELFLGESLSWTDISVPYNNISIRLIVMAGAARNSNEVECASVMIPLEDIKANSSIPVSPMSDLSPLPAHMKLQNQSRSDTWEAKNPPEEGEVVTWCEFRQRVGTQEYDCGVHFGDQVISENSSAMKLRLRFKPPTRQVHRNHNRHSKSAPTEADVIPPTPQHSGLMGSGDFPKTSVTMGVKKSLLAV